jgi:hypothetical protein
VKQHLQHPQHHQQRRLLVECRAGASTLSANCPTTQIRLALKATKQQQGETGRKASAHNQTKQVTLSVLFFQAHRALNPAEPSF